MTARGMRGAVTAVLAAAVLACGAAPAWSAPGAPGAGPARSGSGIVQEGRANAVVVRLLDGSVLRVRGGPRTAVGVTGTRAGVSALQPGFVVSFTVRQHGAALTLRASSGAAPAPKGGTVQSVSGSAVVVSGANGGTVTIAVAPRTGVFLNDSPVGIGDIAAGDRLTKVNGNVSGGRPAKAL